MVPSIQDLDLKGKRVLMRVDFNVPLDKDQNITDSTRIENALPSIEYALKQGGKVIVISHLGRPGGKRSDKYSLKPCAEKLGELLGIDVPLAPDCIGDSATNLVSEMEAGSVLMLENLRFHEGEVHPEKDPNFAKQLAGLGDVYVNDAFGTAHRKHSSTYMVPSLFPNHAAVGFLMEKEITNLSAMTMHPKRPFYAVLGGAKVSTKLGVLETLLDKVDGLFIGGGMAFTFLKAQGIGIGNSLCDDESLDAAKRIIDACQTKAIQLWLPVDIFVGRSFTDDAELKYVPVKDGLPEGWQGMDIGPETVQQWAEALKSAASVFWNGPMGIFEVEEFAKGTEGIAKAIADLDAMTVVGGGDSVAAVNQLGLSKNFTHISTGGGAALEFIEHGHLPGIDVLSK